MTEEANKTFNEILKEIYEKNYKNTKITIDVNPNNMAQKMEKERWKEKREKGTPFFSLSKYSLFSERILK